MVNDCKFEKKNLKNFRNHQKNYKKVFKQSEKGIKQFCIKIFKNHTVIISARCVAVAGVVGALVDIGAVETVAGEASIAGTCVSTVVVFTCGVDITGTF